MSSFSSTMSLLESDYYLFNDEPNFSVIILSSDCLQITNIYKLDDEESGKKFHVSKGIFDPTCNEIQKLSDAAKNFNLCLKGKKGKTDFAYLSDDKASLIIKESDGQIDSARKVSKGELDKFVQDNSECPWTDGFYLHISDDDPHPFIRIKGNSFEIFNWVAYDHFPTARGFEFFITYGKFKKTSEEMKSVSGHDHYNVFLTDLQYGTKGFGVYLQDQDTFLTVSDEDSTIRKSKRVSQEEFEQAKEDRDPASAPPGPYKIQPDVQGHLLWISGPPGSGKSTVCQHLGKKQGFVYYEADCFMHHTNPYIDFDVAEPTMQQTKQRQLKGVSLERVQAVRNYFDSEEDFDAKKTYYNFIVENIINERHRIGGDWAIAGCVRKRKTRDHIREAFEPQFKVIFITLSISKELLKERLEKRHANEEATVDWMMSVQKGFEKATTTEPNSFNIELSQNDNPDDVIDKILEKVNAQMTVQKALETGDYYLFAPPDYTTVILTSDCFYFNSIHCIEDEKSWDTFELSHGTFEPTCEEVQKLNNEAKTFNLCMKIKEGESFFAYISDDKATLIVKEPDGRVSTCQKVSKEDFERFVQNNALHPWRDGMYHCSEDKYIVVVKDHKLSFHNFAIYEHLSEEEAECELFITFGKFKETSDEVKSMTGYVYGHYNIFMSDKYFKYKAHGVFVPNEDAFVTFFDDDPTANVVKLQWLSQDDFEELKESRDSALAPPGPYNIQPGYQGHLLWITGAPGSGKSTVAQLLAKNHGFVYYEGDCFFHSTNPYIPLDVENPTLYQEKQKSLKDLSKDRVQAVRNYHTQPHDLTVAEEFYKQEVEVIIKERHRIGGDWAIAGCVDKRQIRDAIRKHFDPQFKIVFVSLSLTKELTKERLETRHDPNREGGAGEVIKWLMDIHKDFEQVTPDEPNSFNINVSKSDTPEDIKDMILTLIDANKREVPKRFFTQCLC